MAREAKVAGLELWVWKPGTGSASPALILVAAQELQPKRPLSPRNQLAGVMIDLIAIRRDIPHGAARDSVQAPGFQPKYDSPALVAVIQFLAAYVLRRQA